MNRDPSAAPPLSFEILLALGFAALVAWALPDITAWARGDAPPVPALEQCRAELAQQTTLAAHYAGVISGCLNGGTLTEGQILVPCRAPR